MRVVRKKGLSIMASGRRLILVATLVLVLLCISAVLQSGTASAQDANPARSLPDTPVQRGMTFDIMVTFIAPNNDFNAIGLIDQVPTGWTIQVDKAWCTPNADQANTVDNQAGNQSQFMWYGPYSSGESFTALYKVTVPVDAEFDTYLFNGQLGYIIASGVRIFKDIGGDSSTDVIGAAPSTTPTPTPTATPTSTPSPTPTPTPVPSLTPTSTPTPSPTLTPTPASSLTPTPTPSPSPTLTPTPASSLTSTPTPTPSHTLTPTPASSFTSTPTPTPSHTLTPTPASSLTPTPSPTPSSTPTPIPATGGGLGPEAWIGIGIGSLLGILLLVGLVVWIAKRQRIKEA